MSKRLILAVLILTTALFVLMPFVSKTSHGRAKINKVNPAFKEYIAAFTSGFVSSESKLRIVLQKPATISVEKNKELENDLFSFSPGMDGKIVWIDDYTVEFKPAENLGNNKLYDIAFDLKKVCEVPDELKQFDFNIQTIPQAMDVQVEAYLVKDKANYKVLQVTGILNTADVAEKEKVEKCLSASHPGSSLTIIWDHQSATVHKFTIDEIVRQQEKSTLTIEYTGEAIEAREKASLELNIPSVNEFVVLNVKAEHDPDQAVVLQCSDILQSGQNLEGLISILNVDGNNNYTSNNPGPPDNSFTYSISENEIKLFPANRLTGVKNIVLQASIKNAKGKAFDALQTFQIVFEEFKPAIRLSSNGTILPNSEGLIFPFEAVNINAVDVRITKIYEDNVLQFLQVNSLSGNSELRRVGKLVIKKTISLSSMGALPKNKWSTYALDLSKLISAEPGAIYNVSLNFKQAYSIYNCNGDTSAKKFNDPLPQQDQNELNEDDEKDWDQYSYYDSYEDYGDYDYDYEEYNYRERENPCSSSYYRYLRAVQKNILASNIGLMAKHGSDASILVVANDIISTEPLNEVEIEAYDFERQLISSGKTNAEGIARLAVKKKPFVIIAKQGKERNYLKLDDGSSNTLSSFEVNGDIVQKGIKGFIYGERGIWRPGDSLYLSFMLEDKQGTIPDLHPVSLELINPLGQLVQKMTRSQNTDGIYDFRTKTDNYAPTGTYLAKVRVGGAVFTKNVRIETIMPNRLKLKLDFNTDVLYAANAGIKGDLQVNWLHGAPGRLLETKIDLALSAQPTEFKNYKGYNFDNAANSFYSESQTVFNARTNENGTVPVSLKIDGTTGAPGFLSANFTVRAFEEGGTFSTDRFSLPLSPYTHYAGIKIPQPEKGKGFLETGADHKIDIVSVDEKGNPATRNLNVKVYKVNWRWWWDNYNEDLSSYIGNDYHQAVYSENITTSGGKGSFNLRINQPEWGRYLVYVSDVESGHSTSGVVFIDWPSWAGKSPKGNEGASVLNFTTDKSEYKSGETVKMSVPSAAQGRAFVSIESGSRVIKTFWVNTQNGVTNFEFQTTEEMTPNVYIHTTLIQPHAQSLNDLPLRMYGVVPVSVKDETTLLHPEIACADVWKPETSVNVAVSEKDGKDMAYTLAIVDDGLLDLTHFKTPDPWQVFYAKEALGVKTWDVYDMVIGATGSVLKRILSIGGDQGLDTKSGSGAKRFKPMVRFAGPFKLKKGESQTHKIDIPQYVGSVRVMVVAGKEAAYGNAEKTVPVRKPLMILSTLPRVLGPGEEVDLPVTVFAMEKKVKNATITISPDKHFTAVDGTSQSIEFNSIGDQVVNFKLKVKENLGVAKVKISATGAGETATEEIEIEIRTPNPPMTDVKELTLEAGRSIKMDYTALGISGTNKAVLEISSMPPINLQQRLNYLIQYPHGCVEQTTSSVFAQLYLQDIVELSDAQKKTTESNIKEAIKRLKGFQTVSGGLAYWQGLNKPDEWGSNYAGHFLLEAELKGYTLPYGLIDNWKKYQKEQAQNWVPTKNAMLYQEDLTQAYRLYTLALAKSADLGSMNRLKENKNLSLTASWRLAAAYALAGQMETAKKLISNLATKPKAYTELAYTYGSSYRDEAMILETLSLLNMRKEAFESMKSIASVLSSKDWCSTQTTAYSLVAISKFVKANTTVTGINAECKLNGSNEVVNTKAQIKQIVITNANGASALSISNKGKGVLFVRLIREGIPAAGFENNNHSNLDMVLVYKTLKGEPLNVNALEQGTDFVAELTVRHPGYRSTYRNMALTQIFPGGWEIHNSRLDENGTANTKTDAPTYQDIRDDRVYTYFDVNPSGTRVYKIVLNAAYCGKFYLPSIYCEAMYDNSINARIAGRWMEVVKGGQFK